MKCLVIIAHPLEHSLCQHLSQHVIQTLINQGHDVSVEDLYANDFSPALTPDERNTYYSSRYSVQQLQGETERLQHAEALILLYPTWWFSFPAILKGWFDRVWGPGIAYDHASDYGPILPRLHALQHVIAITTLGASWWVDRCLMWQPVKRVLKYAILGTCARHSKLDYLSLYNSEKLNQKQITRFIQRIDRALDKLQP